MSVIYIAPLGGTSAFEGDPTNEIDPSTVYDTVTNVNLLTAAMWFGNVKRITLQIFYDGPSSIYFDGDPETEVFQPAYYNGTYTIYKSNCFAPVPTGTYLENGSAFTNGQMYFRYDPWDLALVSHHPTFPKFGDFDSETGIYVPHPYYPVFKIHYIDGQFKFVADPFDTPTSVTYSDLQIVEVFPFIYEAAGGDTITSTLSLYWTVSDTYFAV